MFLLLSDLKRVELCVQAWNTWLTKRLKHMSGLVWTEPRLEMKKKKPIEIISDPKANRKGTHMDNSVSYITENKTGMQCKKGVYKRNKWSRAIVVEIEMTACINFLPPSPGKDPEVVRSILGSVVRISVLSVVLSLWLSVVALSVLPSVISVVIMVEGSADVLAGVGRAVVEGLPGSSVVISSGGLVVVADANYNHQGWILMKATK